MERMAGRSGVEGAYMDRSYYNRNGFLGFIFRYASGEEDNFGDEEAIAGAEEREARRGLPVNRSQVIERREEEVQVVGLSKRESLIEPSKEESRVLQLDEEKEDEVDVMEEEEIEEEVEEEVEEEEEEEEEDESAMEDIMYKMSMKKLVKAIRKLQAANGQFMDEETVFNILMKSAKLKEFITSSSEPILRPLQPHPLEAVQKRTLAARKAKCKDYSQRYEDHERLAQSYQAQTGVTLQPGRVESDQLLSLLTEQQRTMCQCSPHTPNFEQQFQERWSSLDLIAQVCKTRLKETEENFDQVKQQYKQELTTSSTNEDTPRTIFKAFKSQN